MSTNALADPININIVLEQYTTVRKRPTVTKLHFNRIINEVCSETVFFNPIDYQTI